MEKWVKKTEAEKELLMTEVAKLKVDNENLLKQVKDLDTSRDDGEISSLEDIKDEIKKVKEDVKNDMESAKTGWVDVVKRNIKSLNQFEPIFFPFISSSSTNPNKFSSSFFLLSTRKLWSL